MQCECGNTYEKLGFLPCNDSGQIVEPQTGDYWDGHVLCCVCKAVIMATDAEIEEFLRGEL